MKNESKNVLTDGRLQGRKNLVTQMIGRRFREKDELKMGSRG